MINTNVLLTLLFTFFDGIFQGIWGMSLLGPYLNNLTKDNEHVGLSEGIQGGFQALFSFPAGFLADRYGRDKILKLASVLGLIAMTVLLFGLNMDGGLTKNHEDTPDQRDPNWYSRYIVISIGLSCWGAYQGFYSPALLTIYSDSVKTGQRSKYETWRYVIQILSNASGPIANIVMFAVMGNAWSFYNMTLVFIVGISGSIIPITILFFFRDKNSLGAESDATTTQDDSDILARQRIADSNVNRPWYKVPASYIPAICVSGDIIFGFASGMTIKFFPLFFKYELGLDPVSVNSVYCAGPVCMALFSIATQRISKFYGRLQTVVTTNFIGISLLVLMTALKGYWKSHPEVIVVIYVVRTGFMNCTYPLIRSVLMDYVTKENRGKWNSLESVSMFGWSGSAALGGVLVDRYGYGSTFYATAFVQFLGLCTNAIMLPVVPHETDDRKKDSERQPMLGSKENLLVDPTSEGSNLVGDRMLSDSDSEDGESGYFNSHSIADEVRAVPGNTSTPVGISESATSSSMTRGSVDLHGSPAYGSFTL